MRITMPHSCYFELVNVHHLGYFHNDFMCHVLRDTSSSDITLLFFDERLYTMFMLKYSEYL